MTCYFIVYNVKLGQCIGILPHDQRDYATMVDCGHDDDFHPIDNFGAYLQKTDDGTGKPTVRLVLTNYDHDHFSGLPYLNKSAKIMSVFVPKNLSMEEIRSLKSESTEALETLDDIRSAYTSTDTKYSPPFSRSAFSLKQEELKKAGVPIETNHLSQMVFMQYGETTICIPGDLEDKSWELMLAKSEVQSWLKKTNILIAAHHGRKNGYHKGIFGYCKPDCIIISDKSIVHGTQENMTALYASHVRGNGITYTPASGKPATRKTLTTRNDGHILITVPLIGTPTFEAHAV